MTKRRDFLKKGLLGTVGIAVSGVNSATAVHASEKDDGVPTPGQLLDVAPFALYTTDQDSRFHQLRWGEPRKIRQVVIELPDDKSPAEDDSLSLQYWHKSWNGKADPILAERGAGSEGWTEIDDWTHGHWKDADTNLLRDGNKLTFSFNSTAIREFDNIGKSGVGYRKTLKIRLCNKKPVMQKLNFHVFTDAVCSELTIRIHLGKPAEPSILIGGDDQGSIEIFNGSIAALRATEGSGITIRDRMKWNLPEGSWGGLEADVIMASDPVDQRYDRTILTLRSEKRPVSVLLDEIARGERVLIDDLGIFITRGDDSITLEGFRELRKEFPGRTIYDRVGECDEQTLSNAWNDMPLKHPIGFVHGLTGNRNVMKQLPSGDIEISNSARWFSLNKSSKDSERKRWKSNMPKLGFGFPAEDLLGGRELLHGYLPKLRTWWQDGPVFYEQITMLTKLDKDISGILLDDPTLLLMKVRIVNISSGQKSEARLKFSSHDDGEEKLILEGDRICSDSDGQKKLRYIIKTGTRGKIHQTDGGIGWSAELNPGESDELVFLIPSITCDREEEIAALENTDFDASCQQMCRYWTEITARGCVIHTPDQWLNDFHKSHVRHQMINCLKDPDSERLYPHVGTFSYGVYANESVMMVSDLDRRGYHSEAENCLQTWLDFQGSVMLPGNFSDSEGLFYGAAGAEDGGYNKHHGYVLWGMAEHWWFTRDRAWMEKAASKLVLACDWVIRQRKQTMVNNPDGTRPVEYGFLPTGGLEDVQDYWHWLATNSATVWGFSNLAAALADYGHPEAGRLIDAATAYKKDVAEGLNEARILSPVVRLRDGTYVPKYPSRLYERGRSYGWIRETLEGSIFLIVHGLIKPGSIEARWIMKDYEDNLYISDTYGYNIPVFDRFWFSRGGFSMQSQLLDGPIPYIEDDKIKHFLRAYFNGFTAAFFPQVRMCNEHALPELGYPAGDYFKTSDEAQSTYWLRLMFVREDGDDLYLGQALPRYWLADGKNIGIEKAASHFGTLSFRVTSESDSGKITAILYPPERNSPGNIYVRLRHPGSKVFKSVMINGKPHSNIDKKKEWILLPGTVRGRQEIVAQY
jgi:hypothetical protein